MLKGLLIPALASLVLASVVGVPPVQARAVTDSRSQDPPRADGPTAGASVREKDGVYTVTASFHAAAPASAVKAVLTDFDALPKFLPNVRQSRVLSRDADHVIVEQEIEARMMLFARTIHLRLDVRESSPDVLTFRDTSGKSFDRYDGAWTLTSSAGGGTDVVYTVIAKPSSSVPGFILTRLLKRDSDRLIAGIQTEIASRAKRVSGPSTERPTPAMPPGA